MKLFVCIGLLTSGLVFWTAGQTQAYPQPSIISRAWQVDFTQGQLGTAVVKGLDGRLHWYWYLPYKVANNTGREQLFVPNVVIATDEGDILQAGRSVAPNVYDVVYDRVRNKLLINPTKVIGQLLQGEDNAKESVAIWPVLDHPVNTMTVFIGGLSGETQAFKNPIRDEQVLVAKTLQLEYELVGKPENPQDQKVVLKSQKWVMR